MLELGLIEIENREKVLRVSKRSLLKSHSVTVYCHIGTVGMSETLPMSGCLKAVYAYCVTVLLHFV